MLQKLFPIFACLAFGASTLMAATFDVTASVDRTELELGESLRYTLSLQVNGRMDFPVQIDQPRFDGFQAQGPGRQDGSSWVNGTVTEQHVFIWDLVPIKAGTLEIPAIKANAKDAANGEVIKSTPAFSIKVRRPKNAYNGLAPVATPLPTYGLQSQPTPGMDDTGLRGIKGDRGLPWGPVGAVLGAFAAVLAFLAWWARRSGEEEPALPVVKDPRALAFKQLDAALQRLAAGDPPGFVLGVGHALRGYLRQRMDLRTEVTLAEAVRACVRRLPDDKDKEGARELLERLELLLYGDVPFKADDKALLDQASRNLINTMERLAGR
jgi:hypothetical protein